MDDTNVPACPWLASYEQTLLGSERKGREKRHSPLQPPIEKREGKEIRPDSKGSGLSCARARARRDPRRLVAAAVAEAVAAFHGSKSDELVWARIAWRVGADNFHDAIVQASSEIDSHSSAPDSSELPRIFQNVLNERFPKPEEKVNELTSFRVNELPGGDGKQQEQRSTTLLSKSCPSYLQPNPSNLSNSKTTRGGEA